ncbi:MarR family transcriptional regulator [Jatrophihabitans sp. YIM 134969]
MAGHPGPAGQALPAGHDGHDAARALGLVLLLGDRLRTVLAARSGLTAVESTALSHLAMSGPLTQRHLGDRVGLSTGAVTGLVDRLERHGVCRREPHPTDRRSSYVTLTPQGRTVLADATGELLATAETVPGPRRHALAMDLQTIAAAMNERITGRPRPASAPPQNGTSPRPSHSSTPPQRPQPSPVSQQVRVSQQVAAS